MLGQDTLVVVDSGQRRISLVHTDSGSLTSNPIESKVRSPAQPRGMFRNGSIVVGGGHSWGPHSGQGTVSGYNRPATRYQVMGLDGELVSELGSFPGAELDITVIQLPDGETSMTADLVPFAKTSSVAVGEDLVFVGTKEEWEIKAFDSVGDLRMRLVWDRKPTSVQRRHIEASHVRRDTHPVGDRARRRPSG